MCLCFSFFCFISDFLRQNTPWGCAYVIFGIPGMIRSSSFFFLKAGSSAVIILKVFTTPLSFFFFSSFTAQQSHASVSFLCVCVCLRSFLFSFFHHKRTVNAHFRGSYFLEIGSVDCTGTLVLNVESSSVFFPLFLHHRSSSHTPFSFYFSLDSLGMLLGH